MCTAIDAQRQTASCSTSVTVTSGSPNNRDHDGKQTIIVKELLEQ
jgi:hypothetical protein